jgi:aryl-alcohol dehydrogenase-like predicted oxidoreductase
MTTTLRSYVSLGRSGVRVSPLCLGAMTFGEDWGWGSSVEESKQILDRYTDLGGNFVDTANGYTKGHSEAIIGEHIGRHPSRRDRLVIATKFLTNMYRGDPNGGGAGRKSLVSACENSLRRLQTDYIDLYWMHFWDRLTPIEETMRALDDLVAAGKVRYIGFSDTPAWKVAQAQTTTLLKGWSPLIALQLEYSLLERTIEGELIPAALEYGLGVTPVVPAEGRNAHREVYARVREDRNSRAWMVRVASFYRAGVPSSGCADAAGARSWNHGGASGSGLGFAAAGHRFHDYWCAHHGTTGGQPGGAGGSAHGGTDQEIGRRFEAEAEFPARFSGDRKGVWLQRGHH